MAGGNYKSNRGIKNPVLQVRTTERWYTRALEFAMGYPKYSSAVVVAALVRTGLANRGDEALPPWDVSMGGDCRIIVKDHHHVLRAECHRWSDEYGSTWPLGEVAARAMIIGLEAVAKGAPLLLLSPVSNWAARSPLLHKETIDTRLGILAGEVLENNPEMVPGIMLAAKVLREL